MLTFPRLFYTFLIAWTLTLSSAAQITQKEISLSPETTAQLETGKIIVEIKKARDPVHGKSVDISAMMYVSATAAEIWPVLTDCARAPSITPGLIKCEILEKADDGTWDIRRHTSKIGFGLPHVTSEFRSELNAPYNQTFTRTGGDLKALDGRWNIIPVPHTAYTLVAYQARISSKSIVPDYLLRQSFKKRIPIVMEALRTEIIADTETVNLTPNP